METPKKGRYTKMMMSPDSCVEDETGGMNAAEITRVIRRYEAMKKYYRLVGQHPETYPRICCIDPGPDVHEWFYGEGVSLLKEKLTALGTDLAAEKKKSDAYLFDRKFRNLTGLRLTERCAGKYGFDIYDVRVGEEKTLTFQKVKGRMPDDLREEPFPFTFDSLVRFLRGMGIGAWERTYQPEEDEYFLDGESWTLELGFSDGETLVFRGENAWPENYPAFLYLFGEKQPEPIHELDEWTKS